MEELYSYSPSRVLHTAPYPSFPLRSIPVIAPSSKVGGTLKRYAELYYYSSCI